MALGPSAGNGPQRSSRGPTARRGRWYRLSRRAWITLAAAVPVVSALVALFFSIRHATGPAAASVASIEEEFAKVGPSTFREYLADIGQDASGYTDPQLDLAGLRFTLPVIVKGLAGTRILVFWGIYQGPACTRNEWQTREIQGAGFVPDSDAFSGAVVFWLTTAVTPRGFHCAKISLGRRGQRLLFDFYDYPFRTAIILPRIEPVQVEMPLLPPPPQVRQLTVDPTTGTGTTPTTGPISPTYVEVPTLPIERRDVPSVLRTPEFRARAAVQRPGSTTTPTTTTPTTTTPTTTTSTTTTPTTTTPTATTPTATTTDLPSTTNRSNTIEGTRRGTPRRSPGKVE
jgi:hypothetical protein